ncbi:hypothetical protein INT47_004949 [Mucor saturninus]|uniref:Uncharacterized protein n=1 Tax=Mucor saturninus TaxID=64648 RepID=A0A8H7R3E0_9FUNG|nr:hypothetical protein INT47_004949 [Mucor saturninus]
MVTTVPTVTDLSFSLASFTPTRFNIFCGNEEMDVLNPKYAGAVVVILERTQNQVFSGPLTLSRPKNKRAALLHNLTK